MDTSSSSTPSAAPGAAPPITEADLHAFVDGQLAPARHAAVQAFLDAHPAERERVEDWRAQSKALQQHFAAALDEPLPLRFPLHPAAFSPTARPARPAANWPWHSLAAGVLIAVVSAGSAWWLRGIAGIADHGARPGSAVIAAEPLQGFAHRAAVAHVVYSPDQRRPVEVAGDQEQALVTWLTKRMGASVRPPDLTGLGYSLMGGRLLPGDKGPVAQFMFGDAQGQRLTLYVTREDAGRETAFRFGQDGAVNVFYWVDKDFGYALSAGTDRQALLRVAETVYQQLAPR